ncbi:MAG: ParA family protein [Candidatus Nanopelagicaceae bacterium]
MKTLVIANSAGGVGKSTTVHCIAVAASEYGKKVLVIDADPSAGLTFACGIENPRVSTKEFLAGQFSLEASIIKSGERFSIIASSSRLLALDIDQAISPTKLVELLESFDLVIIDTPTGVSRISTYFMAVANLILLPSTTEILSLRGALNSKDYAQSAGYGGELQLLITQTTQELDEEFKALIGDDFSLLEPTIRSSLQVSTAQSQAMSILTLDAKSEVAADYREVTYSLLEKLELI